MGGLLLGTVQGHPGWRGSCAPSSSSPHLWPSGWTQPSGLRPKPVLGVPHGLLSNPSSSVNGMTMGICHWLLKLDRLDLLSSVRKGELTLIEDLLGATHPPKCFTPTLIEFSQQPWRDGRLSNPIHRLRHRDLGSSAFEKFSQSTVMRKLPTDGLLSRGSA